MIDDKTMLPPGIAERMKELDDRFADLNQQIEQHQHQLNDIAREREFVHWVMTMLRDAGWGPPPAADAPLPGSAAAPPPSPPRLRPFSSPLSGSPAPRERFLRYDIVDLIRRGVRNEDEIFREIRKHREANKRQRDSALKILFAADIIRRDAHGELYLTDEPSAAPEKPTMAEPVPEPVHGGSEAGGTYPHTPEPQPDEPAPPPVASPVVQPAAGGNQDTHGNVRDKILWMFDHEASKNGMYTIETMKRALARQHITASTEIVREAFRKLHDDHMIVEYSPGFWMMVRAEPSVVVRKGPH